MNRLSSANDIPEQTGRTIIITGANSGIGYAAAEALAAKGAHVILGVRDLDRGRSAAAKISGDVRTEQLDLASLASIRAFAGRVDEPVDYLINNAGAMTNMRRTTEDGFEQQFGVNHLGHFALTNLLLGRIVCRVVTITSAAHSSATIDFDDLQWQQRRYSPFGAYGQSKLANLLFTTELQHRLVSAGSSVLSTAAHPGWASTGFTIMSGNRVLDVLSAAATTLLAHGPTGGALPTLLAAVGDVPGGGYIGPSRFGVRGPAEIANPSANALDSDVAKRLWAVSEELTGEAFPKNL